MLDVGYQYRGGVKVELLGSVTPPKGKKGGTRPVNGDPPDMF